jgi:hypothetical protein
VSLRRQKRPCAECPFRKDVEPGQFPAERYAALRGTCRSDDTVQAPLGSAMFACHKSPEGGEFACAGWLAVEGLNHLTVRLAIAQGDLPSDAVRPGEGWPELHEDYEAMARAMGA